MNYAPYLTVYQDLWLHLLDNTDMLGRYFDNTCGATAIEYGLIAAGIAITISGAVWVFGDDLYTMFFETLPTILDGPSA